MEYKNLDVEYDDIFKDQIKFLKRLDRDVLNSIREYTAESYAILNSTLSNNQPLPANLIKLYDNLMYVFKYIPPITREITVFRGVTLKNEPKTVIKELLYGNVTSPPNILKKLSARFVSTSTDRNISEEFIEGKCCKFLITIPKGSKVLPTRPYSVYPQEFEVLLPIRGQYRITDKVVDERRINYYMDYIPPPKIEEI